MIEQQHNATRLRSPSTRDMAAVVQRTAAATDRDRPPSVIRRDARGRLADSESAAALGRLGAMRSPEAVVMASLRQARSRATTDEQRERFDRIEAMARRIIREQGARTLDELSSAVTWAEAKLVSHELRAAAVLAGPATTEGRELLREAGVEASRGERAAIQLRTMVAGRRGSTPASAGGSAAVEAEYRRITGEEGDPS